MNKIQRNGYLSIYNVDFVFFDHFIAYEYTRKRHKKKKTTEMMGLNVCFVLYTIIIKINEMRIENVFKYN